MNTTRFGVASLSILASLFLMACDSDDSNSSVDGGGNNGGTDATGGGDNCPSIPTRMVVLGDSITACVGVGGKDAATCGPKTFHTSLSTSYASGLVYENVAVSGARTTAVPDSQLATVTTGPGHVMVLVYIGGNDLQPLLTVSDEQADTRFTQLKIDIREDWDTIFSFFDDAANFPDGVTIFMNNQYNPFDDCTARPPNLPLGLSTRKNELLREYNSFMSDMADEHTNVIITDQFTSYLGHGHLFEDASCPHYTAGSAGWMNDLIHPNAGGHANLAAEWQKTADIWFADCP